MGILIENITPGMGLVCLRGPMERVPIGEYGFESQQVENRWLHGTYLEAVAIAPPYVLCHVRYPSLAHGAALVAMSNVARKLRHEQPITVMVDTRLFELSAAPKGFKEAIEKAAKVPDPQSPIVVYGPPPQPEPEK